jgi:hypothetical protein
MSMRVISSNMRDILIEHIDGKYVPFVHYTECTGLDASHAQMRLHTINALILRRCIRFVTKSSKYTVITEVGRETLCRLLGEYADALVRTQQMLGDQLEPEWAQLFVCATFVNAPAPELV